MKIVRLLMDHLTAPVGVETVPEFTWIVEAEGQNRMQTAYRLQISLCPDFSALLYDSGVTASDASVNVRADLSLLPCRRYHVRVRVWSGGEETGWYAASFVTGMLGSWRARFVSAETEMDWGHSGGTYLRRTLSVDGAVAEAYLCATALGLYQLSLNGKKVGDEQMAPGWTSYHHQLCYQMWEVTDLLMPGENVLGAHVGAGWYKGMMSFLHERCAYGLRTALLAELVIRYRDGREEHICTDAQWLGCASPVTFAEIYDGERYDARLEQPGWDRPGFVPPMGEPLAEVPTDYRSPLTDPYSKEEKGAQNEASLVWQPKDTLWRTVLPVDRDLSVLVPQPGCRVTIERELSCTLLTTPAGERVLDFGQNLTGLVRFRVRGEAGEKVHLRCFEALDAEGNAYFANLRLARAEVRYTCRGGEEVYQEHFSFQGFRYIKVERWPGGIDPADFTACVIHSDMEETGHFACSNPLLNQLEHNIEWGLRGNFLDIPTDCPQRDERMGWTGDAQIFCRTAAYLRNVYPFFAKWLRDVAFDQAEDGGVPHIVPNTIAYFPRATDWLLSQGMYGAAAWADSAVIIPWTMYLTYGDPRILSAQFDSMKRWIDFMRANAVEDIWNYKLQFGDWVALDAEEGSYFGATPNDLTCTAYYAWSTGLFVKACRILGREELAAEYEALRNRIVKKFQKTFLDDRGVMTVQTQTAHVIALYFGLLPEEGRAATAEGLLRLLAEHDGHLVTGFVGTPYITHALSGSGHVREAYDLLLKEDFPSWLYQVKMGATTVWEHWDGLKPDGTMWSPDMNSFNHYAYGAIGEWLYRVMLGMELDEARPGCRHALLSPKTDDRFAWAEGSFESVYGTLGVRWEREGERVSLTVRVPFNTTATLTLEEGAELLSGDVPEAAGAMELGSGEWHVVYRV